MSSKLDPSFTSNQSSRPGLSPKSHLPSRLAPSPLLRSFLSWLLDFFVRHSRREDGGSQRKGLAVALSILVACLLWFTFTMRDTHTRVIEFPTQVVNLPEDRAFARLPPSKVEVQTVGDGWSLMRLGLRPSPIAIDAEQNEIQIGDVIPELPQGVRVQAVDPNTILFSKEPRVTRKVPVRTVAEFILPPAYQMTTLPWIGPDSVEVTGAATIIAGLTTWPTEPRVFENLRDTLEVQIPLVDTLGGLLERNIDEVTLRAVSKEFTEGFREIEVMVQGQPSNQQLVSLDPPVVEVKYRVPLSSYEAAGEAEGFFVTVSYEDIRRDTTGFVEPRLELPEDILLLDARMIPDRVGYYERID